MWDSAQSSNNPPCRKYTLLSLWHFTYRFLGEDLRSNERQKAQRQQYRSWLEQQIIERRAADSVRKAAQRAYEEALLARDKHACELERMEQECRRQLNIANLRFNKALVCFKYPKYYYIS
jgi:hypothetical protein